MKDIARRALVTAFAFAIVVFSSFAAVLVYHNCDLCSRIDRIIESQVEIKVEVQELQKEVGRLNSLFISETIGTMSSRLRNSNLMDNGKANYYAALIYGYSKRNELDPYLVYSVIQTESSFIPKAVSPKGARGLMQVMPLWSEIFGIRVHDLLHPATNIHVGTSILRDELKKYGSLPKALASYNSGRSRGQKDYIKRVLGVYKVLSKVGTLLIDQASATSLGRK